MTDDVEHPDCYVCVRGKHRCEVHDGASESDDEWMEVYNCGDANKDATPQVFCDAAGAGYEVGKFNYYQTYGGGPEGGFVTDGMTLAEVHRKWAGTFEVIPIKGSLIFRPGDENAGRPNAVKIVVGDSNTGDSKKSS